MKQARQSLCLFFGRMMTARASLQLKHAVGAMMLLREVWRATRIYFPPRSVKWSVHAYLDVHWELCDFEQQVIWVIVNTNVTSCLNSVDSKVFASILSWVRKQGRTIRRCIYSLGLMKVELCILYKSRYFDNFKF